MFVAAGTGNWTAAIFHLGTHAFFKACLFLGAGSVMHSMEHAGSHTPGDIMTMGGLRKHMPVTRITFLISCLAIAGVFPLSGFFSKDEILAGAFNVVPPGWPAWYGKLLWGGLLIAALGTAVYMWRLYFLVFGGEERSDPARKAHESPASMTGPLVILAFLATIAGAIGLPHLRAAWAHKLPGWVTGLDTWLDRTTAQNWVQPAGDGGTISIHASDSKTFALMAIALAIGVLGIGLAWMFYGKGPSKTLTSMYGEGAALRPVYEASKAKLWFDEIYDAIIVRPFKALARGTFEIADKFVIDTIAVNGAAFVVGLLSRVSRWVQNGQVQRYLAGLVVGGALVFFVADLRSKPTFHYEYDGSSVTLTANPGSGLLSTTSKISWDLDGDGEPDPDPTNAKALRDDPVLKVPAGDIQSGTVTLFVEDPISRKRVAVKRTLNLVDPNAPKTEAK
jgi:NADH-quinone oxidoreductase subunit L